MLKVVMITPSFLRSLGSETDQGPLSGAGECQGVTLVLCLVRGHDSHQVRTNEQTCKLQIITNWDITRPVESM